MTSILAADNVGPGGTAFLIVLALIAVTIGIFFALLGSLRRLKKSVAEGKFGPQAAALEAESHPPGTIPVVDAAAPDAGGNHP